MKDIVKILCDKLNDEWALLTAGNKKKFNSMTISWGSFGVLWFKNVVTVYVRPERYTLEFLQKQDYFTVSFYDKKYKKDLQILGTKSGRDTNKMQEISLTPKFLDTGITFNEASQTFV
ncbi:MAG: flavin reductase, partial [Clostridia bacterium]|nr:flavin reductase [Clostridia bacterium]